MRYFKIADPFKFATEDRWGREELKRPKNIWKILAIEPWIYCFPKRNNAYILALFYLLLNVIGFGFSSNYCNLTFRWTKKIFCVQLLVRTEYGLVLTEYGLVLIYCTSKWESILIMWDNLCVKQHSTKLWWRSGGSDVLVIFE